MKLKDISLKAKLNTIIMLTSMIVLLLSSALYTAYDLTRLRESIIEKLYTLADVIGKNSTAAMLFEDAEAAAEILSALSAEPHILSAVLYTKDQTMLASYECKECDTDNKGTRFSPLSSEEGEILSERAGRIHIVHKTSVELFQDISIGNNRVGKLVMRYDLREYSIMLKNYIIIGIIVFTISLIIAFLLSTRLQKLISVPVINLTNLMINVSESRDYSLRAVKEGDDEIGTLYGGFNDMLEQIQIREEHLKDRTNELSVIKGRLEHLLTSSPAVIYSCSLEKDFAHNYISKNIEMVLGYKPDIFIDIPGSWIDHVHRSDVTNLANNRHSVFDIGFLVQEYRFRHLNGSYVWLRDEFKVLYNSKGQPYELVGYVVDITEKKTLEEKMQYDAFHDNLTGLPNRALFMDRLNVLVSQIRRKESPRFAILFIDLDRFKKVNDSFGHAVGDQLLIAASKRIGECLRPGDTIARFGGDEFSIILNNTANLEVSLKISERIQEKLKPFFTINNHEIFTSVSIGISISKQEYSDAEDMIRDADTAMYQAKANGKSCHVLFDEEMHAAVVKSLRLENELRHAIDRGEGLLVHYQPIFAVQSSKVIGFEALVRWNHPEFGFLSPDEFIPVAEESGLIKALDRWVIRQACRQIVTWQRMYPSSPPLSISVNISGGDFSPSLPGEIGSIITETNINPSSLCLEITESIILEDVKEAARLLYMFKDMDVRVHLDDFGTGYSSLSYLHEFPIDTLKIDRSFVKKAVTDRETYEVVRAIASLAHNLRLSVIVEGVENLAQLEMCRNLNCEYAQGYLFCKPMEPRRIEEEFHSMGNIKLPI